jgi:hypothetical protein
LHYLIRTLHGCSLLENAGAYSPEQPFFSYRALIWFPSLTLKLHLEVEQV